MVVAPSLIATPKHPRRFFDDMMNPAPQTPHFVSPERVLRSSREGGT